jgi:hypothetical protein
MEARNSLVCRNPANVHSFVCSIADGHGKIADHAIVRYVLAAATKRGQMARNSGGQSHSD